MTALRATLLVVCALLIEGCGSRGEPDEPQAVACSDRICPNDELPAHEPLTETLFKVNGNLFVVPRSYARGMGAFAFYWPSRSPLTEWSAAEQGKQFYDVAVEVFLRAPPGPGLDPSGYARLVQAEAEGRLISKSAPRTGLEVWRVREDRPPAAYYAALAEKDPDGQPPVVGCSERNPPYDRCFGAFLWQPDVAVDLRFRAVHAADWPEIHRETLRILSLFRNE